MGVAAAAQVYLSPVAECGDDVVHRDFNQIARLHPERFGDSAD